MNLLIKNIKYLAGVIDTPVKWKAGKDMQNLEVLENAFLHIADGKIADYGTMDNCPELSASEMIDATGKSVLPSFIDSHTHIVFAASREEEFVGRIKGLTYEQIAANGGGILNSAKRLQETSEDELYDSALARLNEVIGMGTGAIEIKSGYGLTVEDEIKMLRVIKRLKRVSPIPVKSTFLGAHAIPTEYKENRAEYLRQIMEEMMPIVAEEKLADYNDVFCDRGFFTPEETDTLLEAGTKLGLKPKIHANELGLTGGIQAGVRNHAISVDHLEHVEEDEIKHLKDSATMSTLLPGTAFFLGMEYPPARKMIDAGLPLALASDYNPGSCPSGNMPFVLSLACIKLKITPEEAINAATINGAYALELQDSHGSITKGKVGSVVITKEIPSLDFIPYAFGSNLIDTVIVDGKVI